MNVKSTMKLLFVAAILLPLCQGPLTHAQGTHGDHSDNHFGSSCRTSTSTSAAAVAAHGDVFTASGRLHTLRNFFAFDDTPNLRLKILKETW